MANRRAQGVVRPTYRELRSPRTLRGFRRPRWLDAGVITLLVLFVPLLLVSNPRVAATDEAQYYVYLTSLRFDGDMNFANDYQRLAELNPKANIDVLLSADRIRPKTGLYGNIAPVGSAILWAPFFLAADLLVHGANLLGANIPADGFSKPYMLAICYGSAIYALIGLLLCYRLARTFASRFASTLATATIWLATPLVFYMFIQMAFAHANGFFLVALFLWVWQQTREPARKGRIASIRQGTQRSIGTWVVLGFIGGLMTITREQLGLFLLLPAIEALGEYWQIMTAPHVPDYVSRVAGRRSLGQEQRPRLAAFGALFGKHLVFLAVFVLTLMPQIATYQILNGEPKPASEVGGKFNLCSPHWLDTLIDFDPRPSIRCNVPDDPTVTQPEKYPPFAHGAFVWSPVLAIALFGMLLLWRRDRFLAAVLLVAFLAQSYLNGAFGTTWHLTGSFGFRRLIECSPIFILGLALLLDWAAERIDWRVLVVLAVALIVWNFGLIANWTVLNTELRRGLTWPELWRWQIEVPTRMFSTIRNLLFDRCALMENGC